MAKKKKKDTGYKVAVFGAKGILRLLTYVLVACSVILFCKTAYSFGYAIFKQKPMAEAPGQAVTVVIPEESSVIEIAKILQNKGLVESDMMFVLQEYLSTYHGDLQAGTYLLNTSMVPDEIMAILSGENPQGRVNEEEEETNADQNAAENLPVEGLSEEIQENPQDVTGFEETLEEPQVETGSEPTEEVVQDGGVSEQEAGE